MSFPKLSWGREKHDLANRWPKGPDGTPEKPAFLADSTEEDNAAGMTVEMLRAYGIPVMKKYDDKDGTLADETVKAAVEKCTAALGDGGRVLLRKSGTEPVLRVMAEAGTTELCEQMVDAIIAAMDTSGHLIEVKK